VNRLAAADLTESDVVISLRQRGPRFAPGAAAVVSGSIPSAAVDELREKESWSSPTTRQRPQICWQDFGEGRVQR